MPEFLADIGHVDVEQVRKAAFILVEEMLVEPLSRDHAAAVLCEAFDQGNFPCRERDRFAALLHGVPRQVHCHVADFHDRRRPAIEMADGVVSVIAVVELSKQYQILTRSSGENLVTIALATAGLYLIMSVPLGFLSRDLEQRWGVK